MRAIGLRSSTLLSFVLGGTLAAVACGNGSEGGGSGGGAGKGSGGSSAAAGSGGTSGSAPATGGSGGSTGGTGGSATGGSATGDTTGGTTTGGSGGASGSSGSTTTGGTGGTTGGSSGAAAGGTGGTSQAAGEGGMPDTGTGGSAGTGGGGLPGAVPSDGCGKAAPATGPLTIDVDGTEREYILRLPDPYDPAVPHRIIFAFHGASGSAVQVDNGDPPNSGLDPTGPYYGIKEQSVDTIFVAGQADPTWGAGAQKDIDYVKALITKLGGELCIDKTRLLATGFSMGAIMTINNVACRMADLFRAVAPMSGSLSDCPGDAPIPYWSSHGLSDTTITPANGRKARDEFIKRNGCAGPDMSMPTAREGCVAFTGCTDGYPVEWCEFDGIHEPPPFSGPAIWEFLSRF